MLEKLRSLSIVLCIVMLINLFSLKSVIASGDPPLLKPDLMTSQSASRMAIYENPGSYPEKTGEWSVTISGLNGTVCLGDPYMLTASWVLNPDNILSPLSGPQAIMVKAKLGSFDHETERPGTVSGTTMFIYTGEKKGTETITIQLFNSNSKIDAEYSTTFEVKKCNYLYTLIARTDYSTSDGNVVWYELLKSKGILTAPDPNRPQYREAYNKTITDTNIITKFPSGECQVNFTQPGYALGFVDSKLVEAENGMGVKLMIGPPIDFNWLFDVSFICPDGKPGRVNMTYPLTTSKDPWIEKTFPFSEGEYTITIDMLDQHVKNMTSGGNFASYTAKLSLTRQEAK
jgi:hypothetical protein